MKAIQWIQSEPKNATMALTLECTWKGCDKVITGCTENERIHALRIHTKSEHDFDPEITRAATAAPPRSDWSHMPIVAENVQSMTAQEWNSWMARYDQFKADQHIADDIGSRVLDAFPRQQKKQAFRFKALSEEECLAEMRNSLVVMPAA